MNGESPVSWNSGKNATAVIYCFDSGVWEQECIQNLQDSSTCMQMTCKSLCLFFFLNYMQEYLYKCLNDIKVFLSSDILSLDENKTECILFSPIKSSSNHLIVLDALPLVPHSILTSESLVWFSTTILNLTNRMLLLSQPASASCNFCLEENLSWAGENWRKWFIPLLVCCSYSATLSILVWTKHY